ncbi:RIP metalloprotease RseP [soil metagenome]
MLTFFATIFVLSILIFVHELGHFLAAKSVDIEVPRFSLGLGPRVAGFRIGETDFVLSAIPLGGYVKLAGMEDDEAMEVLEGGGAEPREPTGREFDAKPLWARVWVISAGVLMNFLFAFLVFAGASLLYGERINPLDRLARPEAELLTQATRPLLGVPEGSRVVGVNGKAVANWTELIDTLLSLPAGDATLSFAGGRSVVLPLPASDSARFLVLRALQPVQPPVIGFVDQPSPASRAGLTRGDSLLSVGGRPIATWQEFVRTVRPSAGTAVDLVVVRDGERIPLTVTPARSLDTLPSGKIVAVGRLGVAPQPPLAYRPLGVAESVARGAEATWGTTVLILDFLKGLVSGAESPRSVGSILTIGQISGETARMGMDAFLGFMALFSVNLAVLNLLPIPILDGGQLMFMVVEAVRGRPLSLEQRMRLSQVGLFVIVGLMIWALTNDVLRLFGV